MKILKFIYNHLTIYGSLIGSILYKKTETSFVFNSFYKYAYKIKLRNSKTLIINILNFAKIYTYFIRSFYYLFKLGLINETIFLLKHKNLGSKFNYLKFNKINHFYYGEKWIGGFFTNLNILRKWFKINETKLIFKKCFYKFPSNLILLSPQLNAWALYEANTIGLNVLGCVSSSDISFGIDYFCFINKNNLSLYYIMINIFYQILIYSKFCFYKNFIKIKSEHNSIKTKFLMFNFLNLNLKSKKLNIKFKVFFLIFKKILKKMFNNLKKNKKIKIFFKMLLKLLHNNKSLNNIYYKILFKIKNNIL
jgi:hypothetical protein